MQKKNNRRGGEKKPYEPPKATFVSLKLEERLMACLKKQGVNKCKKAPLNS